MLEKKVCIQITMTHFIGTQLMQMNMIYIHEYHNACTISLTSKQVYHKDRNRNKCLS